jgi:hypothetical protein
VEAVRQVVGRSEALKAELDRPSRPLRRLLIKNPIEAFTGGEAWGKENGERTFFTYDGTSLATKFSLPATQREAFLELLRELVDWRLAQYLSRGQAGD